MNRAQILYALEDIIEAAKSKEDKEPILFIPKIEDLTDDQKADDEYEALGFFVSHNPLDKFKYKLKDLTSTQDLEFLNDGSVVHMGGLVTNIKEITTKQKKQMAFFDLEDLFGRVEVVAFTNIYSKNKDLFQKNKPVHIVGKLEIQSREINEEEILIPKIILMSIGELEETKKIEKIILNVKEKDDFQKIHDIIVSNSGNTAIEIEYENVIIKTDFKISSSQEVLDQLESSCLLRRIYGN